MYNSDLPTKFLRLRKYLEYSQENIAHEMGISPEAYGKIERGKTSISEERLRQLSTIFGFEPWEMLQLGADDLLISLINRKNIALSPEHKASK
ncbi:MAG: helix-turn-helix domain-containing protein [Saprospiraceae bacterium]